MAANGTAKGYSREKLGVDDFDSNTAKLEDIVASMKRDGGVILKNFLSLDIIDQIEKEVRPFLAADTPWDGDSFPPQTAKVTGLVAKSKTYRDQLVMHPQFRDVSEAMLSVKTSNYWGEHPMEIKTKAQLGGTVVFCVRPGAENQPLHRDTMQWPVKLPAITADQYEIGRDFAISLFVAARKLTKANGATRFCPGSHLEQSDTPPDESRAVYMEIEKGDAFMMLSTCYHGGSANTTKDEERLVFYAASNGSWLRQGENQYVIVGNELAKTFDEDVLRWVGYACSPPALGFVDFMDPFMAIKKQTYTEGSRLQAYG